jgi:hypothetical protein
MPKPSEPSDDMTMTRSDKILTWILVYLITAFLMYHLDKREGRKLIEAQTTLFRATAH